MTDNFETDIIERQRLALEAIFEAWDKWVDSGFHNAMDAWANLEQTIIAVRSASTMTGTSEK